VKSTGARLGWLLVLGFGACAEPPSRPPPAERPAPPARGPPALSVGFMSAERPAELDPDTAQPASLECLGTPVIYVGGPTPLGVVVVDAMTARPLAGWCVEVGQDTPVAALGCDPARDPVTDSGGRLEGLVVEPGPLALFARPPDPKSASDALMVVRVEAPSAAGALQVPALERASERLLGLAAGLTESSGASAVVVVLDCAGRPVYGATVRAPDLGESPVYADGVGLPAPDRTVTHVDGLAFFPALPGDDAPAVRVEILGRREASEDEAVFACASVPLRAGAWSVVYVEPERAGAGCGGDR
jgi:hypothetical protein